MIEIFLDVIMKIKNKENIEAFTKWAEFNFTL